MNRLHDTQRCFARFVLNGFGQAQTIAGIKGNGLSAEQRLAIYRNNTQLGLIEALRDGYPVVNRLVGNDFFNHLAAGYVRIYPPKSGCLLSLGGQFADFIADFQAVRNLPYLADTARLEWLWHEAFHEADGAELAITKLADVTADLYGALVFVLQPSARLMASDYPVLRIWQWNQTDYQGDEPIDLNEGGCRLLVIRRGLMVEIIPLNDSECLFLTLLGAGLSLSEAIEQVFISDVEFDVAASLQYWFAAGLFADFHMN